MAFFEKETLKVVSAENDVDISKASINKDLSAVNFDTHSKFFYITVDKILFSDPISTIKSVLGAQGFVANIENILSCLDSFEFSIYAKISDKEDSHTAPVKVNEYLPCIRFELPQKNKVGGILQDFYDEIARYQSKLKKPDQLSRLISTESKIDKNLSKENTLLRENNEVLRKQVNILTEQLIAEKKSSQQESRENNVQDKGSHESLPGNTKICRVEHVDLKRRIVKVKSVRRMIDIPTHMLDRVPEFKARCLITFDDEGKVPLGILFFNNEELGSLERRTADLLYVEGDTFKARDSKRNEFQIKAVNNMEEATIKSLRRGMKVLISIVDGYVVRFSVLGTVDSTEHKGVIAEQLVVYDIGRNQLIEVEDDIVDGNKGKLDE